MSPARPSRSVLKIVLFAGMVIPPVGVFTSLSWLKDMPDGRVYLLTGIAAIVTVVASFWLSILHDRQLDEWNRSNAGFANRWGWTAGACLIAILLALPPFRDLIVSVTARFVPEANPDLVVTIFTFGFMAVVMAQLLCTALLSVFWTVWMSRAPREQA